MGNVIRFMFLFVRVVLTHGGLVVVAAFWFVVGGHRWWARRAAFWFDEKWLRWASCEKCVGLGVDFVVVVASCIAVMS